MPEKMRTAGIYSGGDNPARRRRQERRGPLRAGGKACRGRGWGPHRERGVRTPLRWHRGAGTPLPPEKGREADSACEQGDRDQRIAPAVGGLLDQGENRAAEADSR